MNTAAEVSTVQAPTQNINVLKLRVKYLKMYEKEEDGPLYPNKKYGICFFIFALLIMPFIYNLDKRICHYNVFNDIGYRSSVERCLTNVYYKKFGIMLIASLVISISIPITRLILSCCRLPLTREAEMEKIINANNKSECILLNLITWTVSYAFSLYMLLLLPSMALEFATNGMILASIIWCMISAAMISRFTIKEYVIVIRGFDVDLD